MKHELRYLGTEALLYRLRTSEVALRAQGFFDAAVMSQRHADFVEAGGIPGDCPYSYLDRGIGGKLVFDVRDGWLQVFSSDGAAGLMFTMDRAGSLFLLLLAYLAVTPDELRDLADSIEATPLSLSDLPESAE